MNERTFVDSLIKTLENHWAAPPVVLRASDRYTLGIPDILCFPVGYPSVAIEAKQLSPLMIDPLHRGRRTGQMLAHPFMGPQISMLRRLRDVGFDAFGLVRASVDTAFRIDPEDLPAKTGNFTHEELVRVGRLIKRRDGLWRFWEQADDQVPGP